MSKYIIDIVKKGKKRIKRRKKGKKSSVDNDVKTGWREGRGRGTKNPDESCTGTNSLQWM